MWIAKRTPTFSPVQCDEEAMTDAVENLKPFAHSAQNRCFGCGPANATGLHLKFLLAEGGTVVCLATVPDSFEGPPQYVHGGIIATLLDEAMSKAVRASGRTAMTRRMEIDYLRPVPSGTAIRIEGRITQSEDRKHWAEAKIINSSGTELAHAKGLFIEVRAR
jgi:uncharacterized protein (TIGR00369 family)